MAGAPVLHCASGTQPPKQQRSAPPRPPTCAAWRACQQAATWAVPGNCTTTAKQGPACDLAAHPHQAGAPARHHARFLHVVTMSLHTAHVGQPDQRSNHCMGSAAGRAMRPLQTHPAMRPPPCRVRTLLHWSRLAVIQATAAEGRWGTHSPTHAAGHSTQHTRMLNTHQLGSPMLGRHGRRDESRKAGE